LIVSVSSTPQTTPWGARWRIVVTGASRTGAAMALQMRSRPPRPRGTRAPTRDRGHAQRESTAPTSARSSERRRRGASAGRSWGMAWRDGVEPGHAIGTARRPGWGARGMADAQRRPRRLQPDGSDYLIASPRGARGLARLLLAARGRSPAQRAARGRHAVRGSRARRCRASSVDCGRAPPPARGSTRPPGSAATRTSVAARTAAR
jgi:hypothetical protein